MILLLRACIHEPFGVPTAPTTARLLRYYPTTAVWDAYMTDAENIKMSFEVPQSAADFSAADCGIFYIFTGQNRFSLLVYFLISVFIEF